MPKDFLSVADWSPEELSRILDRARELKELLGKGERPQTLQGRTLAMYFEHPSLRTHVTFEAGMAQLGGHAVFLTSEHIGIGTRESAGDVAQALSRWVDVVVARTRSHALVEELARVATVPVVNALTDLLHPCQAMADLMTVAERKPLSAARIAYVGDGNNVAHSLMLACASLGVELRLATPASHRPAQRVRRRAESLASASGSRIWLGDDPIEAVSGVDFVYTDVWTSMGQEAEAGARKALFRPYQVNDELLAHAPDALVMHDLPAHRGEEITAEVLDGPRSIVFDQAENRLHAQKAVLERLLLPPAKA
ncbi:MAG: ornithine carbamoyltransferase [Myxococcota bacterium]|nr:ornithine carbamoyltransferase [Myxococcota bacterium]